MEETVGALQKEEQVQSYRHELFELSGLGICKATSRESSGHGGGTSPGLAYQWFRDDQPQPCTYLDFLLVSFYSPCLLLLWLSIYDWGESISTSYYQTKLKRTGAVSVCSPANPNYSRKFSTKELALRLSGDFFIDSTPAPSTEPDHQEPGAYPCQFLVFPSGPAGR